MKAAVYARVHRLQSRPDSILTERPAPAARGREVQAQHASRADDVAGRDGGMASHCARRNSTEEEV
jgi:hypothetical protein